MNEYAYQMPYVPLWENSEGDNDLFREKNNNSLSIENEENVLMNDFEKRIERAEHICAESFMFFMQRSGLVFDVLSEDINEIINKM